MLFSLQYLSPNEPLTGTPMSNKLTVVKSNRVVEASYELTLNEQRLILACIAKIKRGEGIDIHSEFVITASEFAQMFGITTNRAYRDLRAASKKLFQRWVIIKPNNGDENEEIESRWIASAHYQPNQGSIRLHFAPIMIPYISLLQSEFTIYDLESISKMNSTYSVRIYELLMQWKGTGSRKIDLSDLKYMLCVGRKYDRLKDFKDRVLHPALKEINESTELIVEYDQYREGRSVKGFEFKFKLKNEFRLPQIKITREYIEKHARAGETYQQAEDRLRKALEEK